MRRGACRGSKNVSPRGVVVQTELSVAEFSSFPKLSVAEFSCRWTADSQAICMARPRARLHARRAAISRPRRRARTTTQIATRMVAVYHFSEAPYREGWTAWLAFSMHGSVVWSEWRLCCSYSVIATAVPAPYQGSFPFRGSYKKSRTRLRQRLCGSVPPQSFPGLWVRQLYLNDPSLVGLGRGSESRGFQRAAFGFLIGNRR